MVPVPASRSGGSPSSRQRRATAILCAVIALATGVPALAAPNNLDLMVPGGTTGLLRVAGVTVPVEPSRAMLVLVRALHEEVAPRNPEQLRRIAAYLAAVARLGRSRSIDEMIDACGFVRNQAGVGEKPGREASERRAVLLRGGHPLEDWAERLSRGEAITLPPADAVPALLPPAVWREVVFRREVAPDDLVGAILTDHRAALFYCGLFSLDEETGAFFEDCPDLLAALYRNYAGPFAAFAESIAVRDGQVRLPGDAASVPIWEALVGEPASAPARFIPSLLAAGDGRLAWLFDALVHAAPEQQAFALGASLPTETARQGHLRQLYSVFLQFERREWDLHERPFTRSHVDPAFVLHRIAATADGRMAAPSSRRLWERALGLASGGAGETASGEVTAAWLVQQLASGSVAARRARLNTVLFAQRLMERRAGLESSAQAGVDEEALGQCLAAFAGHETLMTTLESTGVTGPADFTRAVRQADALVDTGDPRASALRLALFQGGLALASRLARVDAIPAAEARRLLWALSALPADARFSAAMARWVESLLAAVSAGDAATAPAGEEERLLDALAGVTARRSPPVVEWEEHRYQADVAAGERRRLTRIRQSSTSPPLDAALDLARHVAAFVDPGAPGRAATESEAIVEAVSALAPSDRRLFGFTVADIIAGMTAAARERPEGRDGDARRLERLDRGLSVILADVLTSHVYAVAIGDPDSAIVLAGNASRTHDFAIGGTLDQGGPWSHPLNVRAGAVTAVRGSLLGLDRGLAMYWLRPTMLTLPPTVPAFSPQDIRGLGESVAALDAFRLTDALRDGVVAAIGRGRHRVAEAVANAHADPETLRALLAVAGVERWRQRLIAYAVHKGMVSADTYLSLNELVALGRAEPADAADVRWLGLPRRALDGSFGLGLPARLEWHALSGYAGGGVLFACLPDLHLHLLEQLAAANLPAALLQGVLSYAAWDLARSAQMADQHDWLAVMRAAQAVGADRVADYVAALSADGPLLPVREGRRERVNAGPCPKGTPATR